MIYKITNIRLRSGRTLNRGFIIESDKMLSRNKIATLIKERTNFTPVDFSSKIHRSLLESDEDVKAAMDAGNAIKKANKEKNDNIDRENEKLKNSYKDRYEEEIQGDKETDRNNFQTKLETSKNKVPKWLSQKNKRLKELETTKTNIEPINTKIAELNNEIEQKKTAIEPLRKDIENKKKDLDNKKEEYTAAFNNFKQANATYTNSLNDITPLENELKEEQKKLKTELGDRTENELNQEIENLRSEISKKTARREGRFKKVEDNFNDKLEKKYAYSDDVFNNRYKDDYETRKQNKIDEEQGVNLAIVENYFNTKQASLDKMIEKFRNQVKTTTKNGKDEVVYKRLNNTLNKFNNYFNKIKKYVIKQYDPNAKKQEKTNGV